MMGASTIILIGANAVTRQSQSDAIYANVSKHLKGYIDVYIHINYTDHNNGNHHHSGIRNNIDSSSNSIEHDDASSRHHSHRRMCVGQYYSNKSTSSSIPIVDFQFDNNEVRIVQISKEMDKMSVFSDIIADFDTDHIK